MSEEKTLREAAIENTLHGITLSAHLQAIDGITEYANMMASDAGNTGTEMAIYEDACNRDGREVDAETMARARLELNRAAQNIADCRLAISGVPFQKLRQSDDDEATIKHWADKTRGPATLAGLISDMVETAYKAIQNAEQTVAKARRDIGLGD